MNYLKNKIALITGGAQGIGRGIALELARAGADIIVADLSIDTAEAVLSEIKALGREAIAVQLDVTCRRSIEGGIQAALKHFSRIDILVNNAGVFQQGMGLETTLADFDLCYEVNLKGIWQVTTVLAPHFKANQGGKVVNVASIAGRDGRGPFPAYAASKAAVINLTQSLASALGVDNINVNAVCPGVIWTPMLEKIEKMVSQTNDKGDDEPAMYDKLLEQTPLKRFQTPEDIGQAVVFLTSSQAKNITGQALNVDGGLVMN